MCTHVSWHMCGDQWTTKVGSYYLPPNASGGLNSGPELCFIYLYKLSHLFCP